MTAKHLSPKLKKIVGIVSLPDDFDEEKALREVLEKKHLVTRIKKKSKQVRVALTLRMNSC